MQVLSPDVFADLLELPLAALGIIAALGAAIALTGWRWHRFWLTITVSLISGLIGIRQAPVWGIEQPIMAGVLLATAAGCLALSLARVGMFLAYGLTIWYAMKRFAPPYAIPAICICAGGLFSVLFYRFCVALQRSFLPVLRCPINCRIRLAPSLLWRASLPSTKEHIRSQRLDWGATAHRQRHLGGHHLLHPFLATVFLATGKSAIEKGSFGVYRSGIGSRTPIGISNQAGGRINPLVRK
jgi:hypothetical protein